MSAYMRIQMIRTRLGFLLALVEFKGCIFSYLDNLTEKACKMARKIKEADVVSNPAFAQLRFCIPTFISPFFRVIGPIVATFAPCGILWVGNDTLHGVLHEYAKEDKRK